MDAAAAHWWESIRENRLLVQRCTSCSLVQHPPGPWCRRCRSAATLEWMPHPGTGRIVSFTEVFRTTYPEFQWELPYWIVMIELAPGAIMVSNLVRADGEAGIRAPRIGDAVELAYRERGGTTVPVFALTEQEPAR